MQENLLPLSESANVNHKIKTLSRNKDATACDLDVPDAAAFQNTYRYSVHDCLLEQSSLELRAGLEMDWPPFQVPQQR